MQKHEVFNTNGRETNCGYGWSETSDELEIWVYIPESCGKADIRVSVSGTGRYMSLTIAGETKFDSTELYAEVDPRSLSWSFSKHRGRRTLVLELAKREEGCVWQWFSRSELAEPSKYTSPSSLSDLRSASDDFCFVDLSRRGLDAPPHRLWIRLFSSYAPRAAKNVASLCSGHRPIALQTGGVLERKGTHGVPCFDHTAVIGGSAAHLRFGDVQHNNGTGGFTAFRTPSIDCERTSGVPRAVATPAGSAMCACSSPSPADYSTSPACLFAAGGVVALVRMSRADATPGVSSQLIITTTPTPCWARSAMVVGEVITPARPLRAWWSEAAAAIGARGRQAGGAAEDPMGGEARAVDVPWAPWDAIGADARTTAAVVVARAGLGAATPAAPATPEGGERADDDCGGVVVDTPSGSLRIRVDPRMSEVIDPTAAWRPRG